MIHPRLLSTYHHLADCPRCGAMLSIPCSVHFDELLNAYRWTAPEAVECCCGCKTYPSVRGDSQNVCVGLMSDETKIEVGFAGAKA